MGSFPLTLELSSPLQGKRSWIKVSQIWTLSIERIRPRLGRATSEEAALVVEGLLEIVGN